MEDKDESEQMLLMLAGISLPGVIGKAGMFITPKEIAKEAFDIAEAMLAEYVVRTNKVEAEDESNS